MARFKVEPGAFSAATGNTNISIGNLNVATTAAIQASGAMLAAPATVSSATLQGTPLLGPADCYEDAFKEITKKLYGDDAASLAIAEVLDPSVISSVTAQQPILYETADLFRHDVASAGALASNTAGGLAIVAATPGGNGLPAGTILVQRRLQDEKGRIWTIEGLPQTTDQIAFSAAAAPNTVVQPEHQASILEASVQQPQAQQLPQPTSSAFEERWFESDEQLSWTQSRIARYNPTQKVFRCVDCDFVGFLSRVAEHWLGNHADLRVFQCPRCNYTSAWARCVRMHLTRQHGETLADNSLWKENPVLEEVTKFLNTLKTKVEQKSEPVNPNGEKRYTCPYCPYQTDRRDLYNRHENIHRDEKPFQCYVCDKQFNRADHVKKHFMRMHREHNYDINKIRKATSRQGNIQFLNGSKVVMNKTLQQRQQQLNQMNPTQQQSQLQVQQQATHPQQQLLHHNPLISQVQIKQELGQHATALSLGSDATIAVQLQQTNQTIAIQQQIPHIAYFNPPQAPGQSGPLQGIAGVGGTKKESKSKGTKKKKANEKMYTCSYCPWQGVDNWCLKRHLNTHIKPFLCALCDYKAARSERLATHVLKVHNKRVCHKCSFLADDSESLSQHIQDSHQNPLVKTGFNCNICQEYFELRADLEAHAILEHQKVIVQCDLCDFRTTDELSMEAHLRDKHNLTPGMGAVAAAAAAAAAAAIGQPLNPQFMQPQQAQPQLHISEQINPTDQLLAHTGVISTAIRPGPSSAARYSGGSANLPPLKSIASLTGGDASEPETLCEKCGIDFADEQSRKLHERRHELVNPKEDEAVKGAKSSAMKRYFRSYVCSTCSYTCATKKMMMQHQRAHTGFDLVCQAENCMFSTPFDNSLKEHILNDHGSVNGPDDFVRCPHCGLVMPSSSAFTSHWRFHHRTICSLCVNIYRVRYDAKENDIHDDICKTPTSTSMVQQDSDNSGMLFNLDKVTSQVDIVNGLSLGHSQRMEDDLEGLVLSESLNEPLVKRQRLELPLSSTATLYNRESIKFLPRLVEVTVVPMSPKVKARCASRKRRRKRRKWSGSRRFHNIDGVLAFTPMTPRKSNNLAQSSNKLSRLIQQKETALRDNRHRIPLRRRYCQRGTFSWLYRNPRDGFKCLNHLCENRRSWRYPRKIGLVLHNLWYHRLPRFKCDICGLQFCHMYQAFLHKIVQHADFLHDEKNQTFAQAAAQLQHHIDSLNQVQLAAVVGSSHNPLLQ